MKTGGLQDNNGSEILYKQREQIKVQKYCITVLA